VPNRISSTICFFLIAVPGCPAPSDPAPEPPPPIGPQLLEIEGSFAIEGCASSRLYRDGRRVQYQCFDSQGAFSWDNRGTLTESASAALDSELASAALDATTPVNHKGLCGAPDSGGEVSLWVGEERVSFAPFCLFEGIVALYDQVAAILFEIEGCEEPFAQLESVDPGCRAY